MSPLSRWKWESPSGPLESGGDSDIFAVRLDRALALALEMGEGHWEGEKVCASRSQLQRLIEEGCVQVNGAPSKKANEKLRPGSRVQIEFPPPREISLQPEARPLEVLFEDRHLVVLNKPPGLTVHPSSTQADGTLVNALLHQIRDLSGIGGELRPGIVHRLDKDTSGALVVSKTDETHRALTEIFSRHAIERAYWALCYGSPRGVGQGAPLRIETRIGRNPADRKKMTVLKTGGRLAISHVRKLEEYSDTHQRSPFASWLEVRLETGRTHQVRVHLTSLGHSLLGDPVYGTPTEKQGKWVSLPPQVRSAVRDLPGQALHARVLGFTHPITGEKLRFEAEPPECFRKLLEALKENSLVNR